LPLEYRLPNRTDRPASSATDRTELLAPPETRPADGEVHVWCVPLDRPPYPVEALRSILSPEEQARAARFRFDADRRRAVVGRGLLRVLLSGCGAGEASGFRFGSGPHGRPLLTGSDVAAVDFNVAHSGGWVMIALARGGRVGVDVEEMRALGDMDGLLDRFFAPGEVRSIRALEPELRESAFFACWTRKESFVKALGDGISLGLDRFEVELRPGWAPRLISIDGSESGARRWTLWSAAPDETHRSAVATDVTGAVRAWMWSADGLRSWTP
jgi:4'-phosphopantetheinyl transferase